MPMTDNVAKLTQLGAPPALLVLLAAPGPSQPICATCFTSVGNPICISGSLPSGCDNSVWKGLRMSMPVSPWYEQSALSYWMNNKIMHTHHVWDVAERLQDPLLHLCAHVVSPKLCLCMWVHALYLNLQIAEGISPQKVTVKRCGWTKRNEMPTFILGCSKYTHIKLNRVPYWNAYSVGNLKLC